MPAIDVANLQKAMARAPMTPKQLSVTIGMSLQYTCDIVSGRRTLKRSPVLRRAIADALDVPVHWIERQDAA